MPAIEISHLAKPFADAVAVDDASFAVERGKIFGLLGPNGAGKATTIRLMLDIFKPGRPVGLPGHHPGGPAFALRPQ
jgi:ABC-2 type transport system ATP-binding protein